MGGLSPLRSIDGLQRLEVRAGNIPAGLVRTADFRIKAALDQ